MIDIYLNLLGIIMVTLGIFGGISIWKDWREMRIVYKAMRPKE